ncbi:MAG TPA: sensor domain-containing protein [Nocardioides sp.]|nr:sensor domain-containing protein [Nocardioides sp.]
MSRPPDAWTAVRGSPWPFLRSAWPWRSFAYLLTSIPLGLATLLVLALGLVVGVATLVVVVGAVVLAGLPVIASAIGVVERRRLGLVRQGAPNGVTFRERLRAGRRLPVSWPETGYAVLLAAILWWVDFVVLLFAVTTPVVLLISPLLYDAAGPMELLGWRIDTLGESIIGVAVGVPALAAAAYLVTLVASAQAGLARMLLDPREEQLAAAVADLRRSRVDLVDAFEIERRRIERDLHDGVQQRLVALTMTLGRAELDVAEGPGLELVRRAHEQAEAALDDLRGTVRGIHPRVLADHGLAAAVHEIADRAPVPVSVDIRLEERPPAPVEAAAYFVASEALTNVARHARARQAQVHAWQQNGSLVLTVVDDGVGGADAADGTGLAGLLLRLEALGGELVVTSPAGGPTEVRMEVPCQD